MRTTPTTNGHDMTIDTMHAADIRTGHVIAPQMVGTKWHTVHTVVTVDRPINGPVVVIVTTDAHTIRINPFDDVWVDTNASRPTADPTNNPYGYDTTPSTNDMM